MATRDHERGAAEDQENRIENLKDRARQLSGGAMKAWESDELPSDMREDFWRRVVEFETAPLVTDAQRLADAGIHLPAPDTIDDAELLSKLWEVINALRPKTEAAQVAKTVHASGIAGHRSGTLRTGCCFNSGRLSASSRPTRTCCCKCLVSG